MAPSKPIITQQQALRREFFNSRPLLFLISSDHKIEKTPGKVMKILLTFEYNGTILPFLPVFGNPLFRLSSEGSPP